MSNIHYPKIQSGSAGTPRPTFDPVVGRTLRVSRGFGIPPLLHKGRTARNRRDAKESGERLGDIIESAANAEIFDREAGVIDQ